MLNWKHVMKLCWKNILRKYRSKQGLWANLATMILPSAVKYQNVLIENIKGLKKQDLRKQLMPTS